MSEENTQPGITPINLSINIKNYEHVDKTEEEENSILMDVIIFAGIFYISEIFCHIF